jgi:hypothetical protein
MKCEDVQRVLVFYLDGELPPFGGDEALPSGQRDLVRQHLAGCKSCQNELAELSAARDRATEALQGLAARAEPSPQAWNRLQARLAKEARPSPSKLAEWLSRLAPGMGRSQNQPFRGDLIMRKRLVLPALAVVLVIAVAGFFLAQTATPVSAQQVLQRAYAVQSATPPAAGILHIKLESYFNLQGLPGSHDGTRTISESYRDLATGILRQVITRASDGKVLEVFGYDGAITFSSKEGGESQPGVPLTVYRVPQKQENLATDVIERGGAAPDWKGLFDDFRSDPKVELNGPQPWADGRSVYVLISHGPVKMLVKEGVALPEGLNQMVFDAKTYQLLESRMSYQKDGAEIVVSSQRYLANEVLPANSPVAWNMSDLQGVSLVDDPQGEFGDMLPEKVSQQALQVPAYVLSSLPTGFEQEITAPPQQKNESSYIFIISYRNAAGDYFVLQANDKPDNQLAFGFKDEVYTTASGLVLHFEKTFAAPNSKTYETAVLVAPDGSSYILTSTLPRDQVKALAEKLVRTKG